MIDINIYLTQRVKGTTDIKNVMTAASANDRDIVTGLRAQTNWGRPNWNMIFDKVCRDHPNEEVGVFFCGPAVVSKQLYATSRAKTFDKNNTTTFKYLKENF